MKRSVLRKSVQGEFRWACRNSLNPPKVRKINDQSGEKRSSPWSGGARDRFFVRKIDFLEKVGQKWSIFGPSGLDQAATGQIPPLARFLRTSLTSWRRLKAVACILS